MSPNDVLEAATKASAANDRTLFIAVIIILGGGVVFMVRYVITKISCMVDKSHEVTTTVAVAISRNTEALDNTSAVIVDNSKVIQECNTELIRCRQAADSHS